MRRNGVTETHGEERFDGSAGAAGRPGAAGSDRKHERFEIRMALVFPIRSGSARRFATPVEPPSVFLRFFVSPCLAVTSVSSVAASGPPPSMAFAPPPDIRTPSLPEKIVT